MRHKFGIFAFIALISSAPASAADWWFVGSIGSGSTETAVFVDAASIMQSGNTKTAWTLWINETADEDGVRKERQLTKYDCTNRTRTLVSLTQLGNNNRHIETITWATYEQEASYVEPESIGEGTWKIVCEGPTSENLRMGDKRPEEFAVGYFRL